MLNYKIRDAEQADMEAVHRIFNDVLLNTTATFEENPYSIETWIEIFKSKKKDQIPFIVAEHEGLVIGFGNFGPFRRASGYKITVEHTLHVDKDYRGQGIGGQILSHLIKQAKIMGIENMVAAVDADNLSSVSLHKKFGFLVVGEMKNVARKFSTDLSLVLMQLSLL